MSKISSYVGIALGLSVILMGIHGQRKRCPYKIINLSTVSARYLPIFLLLPATLLFLSSSICLGQKVQDVSGLWTLRFKGEESHCQNEAENGPKQGTFIFRITQEGNNLSSTWVDGNTTNVLTGKVSGYIVNATVHGVYPENCRVVTEITGEILGKEIKGRYSGRELNCETCVWEGDFTAEITK
jgi:hypothetical protein